MGQTFTPLTEEEVQRLDQLLGEQGGEQAMTASEVHGYFSAIAAGPPVPLNRDDWLPAILGGAMPEAEPESSGELMTLLGRLYMQTSDDVLAGHSRPLFTRLVSARDGEVRESAGPWTRGFLRGVGLQPALWRAGSRLDASLDQLMAPILELGRMETAWHRDQAIDEQRYRILLGHMGRTVLAIAGFWRQYGERVRAAAG